MKITAEHLARGAYVYVRQSTADQLVNNPESWRRQYGLAERARSLGWKDAIVIDEDLGRSGSGISRPGFEKLLAAICEGRVGAVLAIEASRLARNGRDWHTLIEFCGLVGTLIIDEDGIYEPRHPNDRLLLGMKGTMSELELSILRARSIEALKQKARRGELFLTVAIGYVKSGRNRIEKDPDLRIREAIDLVFRRFDELQSIRQVHLWLRSEGIMLPAVNYTRAADRAIVWKLPVYNTVHHILTNPIYAGAYAFGRTCSKVTTALKRKINPTRVPIEQKESMRWLDNLRLSTELTGAPERCVHVGDRESDIYELYCLAEELGTNFLVRSCVDRLAEDGGTTIAKVMAQVQSSGTHEVRFRDSQGKDHCAVLSVRNATMTVRPPIGKQRKYRHQELQIIHAEELDPPEDRTPILWKLITNLPVATHADAVHKLEWYALRWKIETFFRTLKTGCRIEELRLATADRLANCIALCCVVSWRVSWLAMLSRDAPAADPAAVFTEDERHLLDQATPDRKRQAPRNLQFYVRAVARLGGYLDRASDAPPGTTVIWRGFSRLADLVEGARLAKPRADTCG